MLFLEKCKESVISAVPVVILVLLLHFTAAPLGDALPRFLVGAVLFVVGLGLFLVGADIGVLPVGQKVGSTLTSKRNLALMLAVGFTVGFIITVAEPDVQVLAAQVVGVAPVIDPMALVCIIGVGVGFFVAVAMGRIIFQLSLKLLLLLCYLMVFLCAAFTPSLFLGIGFDAGGATTGPMTVPFIMALGVGVAAVRGGAHAGDDSFGFVGLASVGPILAVLVLGLFASPAAPDAETAASTVQLGLVDHFLHLLPEVLHEVSMALGPLAALFLLFRLFLIKLSHRQTLHMVMGLVYTFLGVVLFFLGLKQHHVTGSHGLVFPANVKMGFTGGDKQQLPVNASTGSPGRQLFVCFEAVCAAAAHDQRLRLVFERQLGVVQIARIDIHMYTRLSEWTK